MHTMTDDELEALERKYGPGAIIEIKHGIVGELCNDVTALIREVRRLRDEADGKMRYDVDRIATVFPGTVLTHAAFEQLCARRDELGRSLTEEEASEAIGASPT